MFELPMMKQLQDTKWEKKLVKAVKSRDWSVVEALLLKKAGAQRVPRRVDKNGMNVFHHACWSGASNPLLKSLIRSSSTESLTHRDDEGSTPLHVAVRCASAESALTMIDACPAAAVMSTNTGDTPLHVAVYCNRCPKLVARLLRANPLAVASGNDIGDTPLEDFFRAWNLGLKGFLRTRSVDENAMIREDSVVKEVSSVGDLRDKTVLFLKACHKEKHGPFSPVRAAMALPCCPWAFVRLLLVFYPTEESEDILRMAQTSGSSDSELYECWECDSPFYENEWFQHAKKSYLKFCKQCRRNLKSKNPNVSDADYVLIKGVSKLGSAVRCLQKPGTSDDSVVPCLQKQGTSVTKHDSVICCLQNPGDLHKQNLHNQRELHKTSALCKQLQTRIPNANRHDHNSLDGCYILMQIFLLDFLYDNFMNVLTEIQTIYH